MPSLRRMAFELDEAGQIANDEVGEWWIALAGLHPAQGSDEFNKAYEKELREEYRRFKEEFRIEKTTETHTTVVSRLIHESEE